MEEIHITEARIRGLKVAQLIEAADADMVESALNNPTGLYDPKGTAEVLETYKAEVGDAKYAETLAAPNFAVIIDAWEKEKQAHNTTIVVKRIRSILPEGNDVQDGDILCFIGLMNGQIPSE